MRNKAKRISGYSLIEIVISLTILAAVMAATMIIFLKFSRSLRKQQDAANLKKETEAAFIKMDRRISGSFGWIAGDSLGITLIDTTGDSTEIYWNPRDSMLYRLNEAMYPRDVKISSCIFYYMPRTAEAMGTKPETWLKEVDLDGNGILEGLELKNVGLLVIKLKAAKNKAEHEGMKHFKLPPEIVDIMFLQ